MKRLFLVSGALLTLVSSVAAAEDAGARFTLNGDETPTDQPWSEPATFSYTRAKGGKDSLALDLAVRRDWRVGPTTESTRTAFVRGVAHRNDAAGSQVESYSAEAGLHFEPSTATGTDPRDYAKAWYFFNDLSLGYNYTTNFDDEKDGCDATPRPAYCVRSHQGSVRLKWAVQPYNLAFDAPPAFVDGQVAAESPHVSRAFGVVVTAFTDQVLTAKTDAAGVKPKGNVTGAAVGLNLALSPRIFDYRLVFRASMQQTHAFARSNARRFSFPSSSTLGSLSLDYELGPSRSFEKGPGWVPAIGVSYKRGDDPLSGRLDQEETVIGFKLSHKSGSKP